MDSRKTIESSPTFVKIKRRIHMNHNTNAFFSQLDWPTRLWIFEVCRQIDMEIAYINNIASKMKGQSDAQE